MPMSGTRSFGLTALLFGLAGFAGTGALIWGHGRQVYRVPHEAASEAFLRWCTSGSRVDPVAGERYLSMFGDRYSWIDLGLGLIATALTGLLLAGILFSSRPDGTWLRTPSRRWHFMLAGWAVLAWTHFSVIHSFEKDLDRRQLPWCADSIGIPIYSATLFTIILLAVCTFVGGLLTMRFRALPASLSQWDPLRPLHSWIVTIIFGVIIALIGTSMVLDAGLSMSIANPAGLLAVYLLASTRAALLAPKPIAE